MVAKTLEEIVALAKRRGFVYPGSDIYGGLANTYDYGPLGVELKNNIKKDWWRTFVLERADIYGLDGGILLNPKVWEASGHVDSFTDDLVECKKCHKRHKAEDVKGKCPACGGELADPKVFNGMFKTYIGATEDKSSLTYLRPETAQAIFINYKNVVDTFSPKLPFGIAQIGKAFRNEVTAGYFIFRLLEFEQMEIEYFINESDWEEVFEDWQKQMLSWTVGLGIKKSNLKYRQHTKEEMSHYSKKTVDLEYKFPIGFKELYGLAYRTDYDLASHAKASGVDLSYRDKDKKFLPHVVEPSFGMPRTFLAVLLDAYTKKDNKVILKLAPKLAPYKVAVFPLLANKPKLVNYAKKIFGQLKNNYHTAWDSRGNIGKRYAAQDEIGTPFCITCDFDTLEKDSVTVRDRDTAKQERVSVDKLPDYLQNKLT